VYHGEWIMAKPLRVLVELHGKGGVSLHRLPQLLANIQQFLDMLAADTHAGEGSDWTGLDFHGAEPSYTAATVEHVAEDKAGDFYRAFRAIVKNRPDERVRYATLAQFAQIAESLEPNERVEFGLVEEEPEEIKAAGSAKVTHPPDLEWLRVTKETAATATIANETQALVKAYGSVQGIIHSLFLRSRPPYFHLRELSTGNLVRCIYEQSQYQEIVQALTEENAVLHVFGLSHTDLTSRKLIDLRVDKIEVSHKLTLEALEHFIGSAPELLGDTPLQKFLDESRGRE
jgi:hypothetical protein